MKNYSRKVKDFHEFELMESNSSIDKSIKAKQKVKQAIIWCISSKGFFAEMISDLNIYGSTSVKTMQTNGLNIVYGVDFVLEQNMAAVRLVLLHEVLHCFGQHMSRRGGRDPYMWNVAADFAINPILAQELKLGEFEWPKFPDGSPMGLYEERFAGKRAEDIYEIVITEKKDYSKNFGEVIDADKKPAQPDNEEDIVRKTFKDIKVKPDPPKPPGGGGGGEEPEKGDDRAAMPGEIIVVKEGPSKGKIFQVLEVGTSGLQVRELTPKEATRKLLSNKI
jgi:hypothetical protein